MPKVDVGTFSLRYEITGSEGLPVLLLSNSLGTRLEMWEPQMNAFTQQFRVLRYDMRGHGDSGIPAGPYSIEMLARDVLSLLDCLSLEKVHFCGLSVGGVIGQWLGAQTPERIDHLVLCNTAAKIGTAATWNDRIANVRAGGMGSIADAVLTRWFTPCFMASEPATIATMRDSLVRTNVDGYMATCEAIRDMDQREMVKTITAPTLMIAGADDSVTTVRDAELLQDAIPGSKTVTMQAAHISNVEAPAAFTSAVLNFLLEKE